MSPYLRRPLRPLDKVLSEREDRDEDELSALPASDGRESIAPTVWDLRRKSAVASE